VATLTLTVVILIFSEVTPKTVAALHPERIAFPASWVLGPLLRAFYPLVWAINGIANFILRPFNVSPEDSAEQPLSPEELRTVVLESGSLIPQRHRRMLLSVLDMQEATVEDIMIPSREVYGLDLEMDWEQIRARIVDSPYTRLPVYRGDWDRVVGFVHLRRVVAAMSGQPTFDRKDLEALVREPYFIPEGTPLHSQLMQFQQERRRIGMVVDEYGEMLGLATLEDILEEIVGEFTTDPAALRRDIRREGDDCYLVDGRVSVRTLNRSLNWNLPTDGPRTLSGTVVEHLEAMPSPGISLMVAGHPVEIVETMGNRVKLARIRGRLKGRKPRLPAA
jgi:Mg2+/Co2+ transporter CorB